MRASFACRREEAGHMDGTTTESLIDLARSALKAAKETLPTYSSPKSRHDFTQPQLAAMLALKRILRTNYRGLVATLAEWPELRRALGLRKVPHYSTLCYAARRFRRARQAGGRGEAFLRAGTEEVVGVGASEDRADGV
jgi:hypothetical protein